MTIHIYESDTHCESLSRVRDFYMNYLLFIMPLPMKLAFLNMSSKEKALFILSGLNCDFCQEWMYIYRAVAVFVYEMYKYRKKLHNNFKLAVTAWLDGNWLRNVYGSDVVM